MAINQSVSYARLKSNKSVAVNINSQFTIDLINAHTNIHTNMNNECNMG